jgi:hypothetical protein
MTPFHVHIADLFSDEYYAVEMYECNLDLVFDQGLYQYAIFYYIDGMWEGVMEEAESTLEGMDDANPEDKRVYKPLEEAVQAYKKFEESRLKIELSDDEVDELDDLEHNLVKELLEFCGDPDMFIVIHILDTIYESSQAWFVCYRHKAEELLDILKPYKLKVATA